MTDRTLGFVQPPTVKGDPEQETRVVPLETNTRVSLWPDRWPAIALQECIDKVEAAPLEERSAVKFGLPCQTCPKATMCLNAKRKELGPLLYDREIQTKPRSSESSLFPREMMEPMLRPDESLVPYWHKPFSLEHEYAVVQAWDLAWSEKIGGDYLVCETAYVHRTSGRRHMLDIERWQRLTFPEQCTLIELKWKQFQSDLVVIESDVSQRVWSQHLSEKTAVPVLPHAAAGKTDLAAGVPGLLILLENRKWELPFRRGSHHQEEMSNLLDELEAFGWVDGKLQGVGEHDDTVMAFWHLNWGIDRMLMTNTGGSETHRGTQPGKSG